MVRQSEGACLAIYKRKEKIMEIRQLQYFVGIAETGRFSEASKVLFVTQSAVSQQIKLLEEELGTQLFVRHPHSITLTESGQELLPLAKSVLSGVNECHNRINDLKGLLCGTLNIGLTFSLEPYIRETTLTFLSRYPKIKLNAYYKCLPDLLRMLKDNEIDIMFSMMPTSPHEFVSSVHITDYCLAAVMNKNHPLAKKKILSFADLQPHKLILPEKGLRDRNAIESFVHTPTGELNVVSLINDVNAIMNMLQESKYISILTENVSKNYPQLCSIPVEELSKPIPIYAHYNNRTLRKHSAEVFVETLLQSRALFAKNHNIEAP